MNDGGKGDKQRPTDQQKFSANYDQIKWTLEEDEEFKRIESRTFNSVPRQSTQDDNLA